MAEHRVPGLRDREYWGKGGAAGTGRTYLLRRLKRVAPELAELVINREISAHAAAVEAGIITRPSPKEAGLQRLLDAWGSASLEDRAAFLFLAEEEAEATCQGIFVNELSPLPPRRRGPRPERKRGGGLREVEALLERGWSVSALARELEVTYRTLARWRNGQRSPNQAQRDRLSLILLEAMTDEPAAQLAAAPAEMPS